MKNISVLSTLFVLAATGSIASESVYETTGRRRVMATGHAYATIFRPASVSITKNADLNADGLRIAKKGKIEIENNGEIRLSGPKNQVVAINVSSLPQATISPKAAHISATSRIVALDSLNGEAKVRLSGISKNKKYLNSDINTDKTYVFQVSY